MSANELSIVIKSLLSLIVLIFLVFRLWPEQRIDIFRQEMFALRDELFDFAADDNISFDDPAYQLLRDLMNGFIRYAHNLTPYRTLMSFLRWKCQPREVRANSWTESWEKAIYQVPDGEARTQMNLFHSKATMLVMSQLLLSPIVLIFGLPVGIAVAIYSQWTTIRKIYKGFSEKVPMQFLEEEAAKS